jgi:hypothetical protein
MQIALAMEIWQMGKYPTETQTLKIGCCQIRLQHTIDEFITGLQRYFRDEDNNIRIWTLISSATRLT